ncbi:hypothetical protein RE428_42300 [Marinobacter nanhaiticus D15-8W]|uniref:hypothetical protein n=1 Tax=Marinobacter nanhaiticus TaxID=1305740 RepID=UPI0002C9591A|nr:hypothetical protein [Marinobacter nanhaiticus]BES73212.1 hypothetical protein RE428_42300 [Marinobacter nanhaiticus D15-8W]
MFNEMLTIWSDSPALSLAVWLAIAIVLLYAGRPHAHQLLRSTGRAVYTSLRLASVSLHRLEARVIARNHDVLLAAGREAAEKTIEREFNRVNAIVERDLSQYPVLHRRLTDTLEKIQQDYHDAIDNAPMPPAWQDVLDTLSTLPRSGDPAVASILENICEVVEDSHEQTLRAYQESTNERHGILKGMQPDWRTLTNTMKSVSQTITGLEDRARKIDNQMADYESIRKAEDKAVNALTSSSLTQFFIASLVLAIAVFGGIINFHLISMPMAEMVGGASYIGSVRTSDVAALVIILVEIAMGLFLLECLQITRLFPVISSLDDRVRKRMAIVALTILVIFAGIESSLAYMRDLLALDAEALQQTLAGAQPGEPKFRWVPSIGQMLLGFILPFALAFVGIPLESFVHSLRTVSGLLALGVLRTLRVALRMIGGVTNHLSKVLVNLYDVFIMVPLSIERLVMARRDSPTTNVRATEAQSKVSAESPDYGDGTLETRTTKTPRKTRRSKKADEDTFADDLTLNPGEA